MDEATGAGAWAGDAAQAKLPSAGLHASMTKQQQAEEVRRLDSLQEAHLIKAFQGHQFENAPLDAGQGLSPTSLQRRQQEWLEQHSRPASEQAPDLPEFHLQLPQSMFQPYSAATPFSASGSGISTLTPMEQDAKPSSSPAAALAPCASGEQQTEDTLAAPVAAPADSLAMGAVIRSASSIKPRERKEPERYSSQDLDAPQGAGSILSSRRISSSIASGHSDGVMMLLQACEALDGRRNLTPTSSYSPSRPPRPRSKLSDVERIRASFSRAHSDSAMDRHSLSGSASRREKENAAVVAGPPSKKERAAPKQIKARRGRSELHGPCCHCLATESPQWRKGPRCKPILCNACGTRFLRTRSLGKSMGKGSSKKLSFSSASSCNLDDMPAELDQGDEDESMADAAMCSSPASSQAAPATPAHIHQALADMSC